MRIRSKNNSKIFPLKWIDNFNLTSIFEDIKDISSFIKEEIKNETFGKERRESKKMVEWNDQLEKLIERLHKIETLTIPSIEYKLNIKFQDPKKVVVALFTRTIKNIFLEMKQDFFFRSKYPSLFNNTKLDRIINLNELAEGLATLGDQVLGLVVVQKAWEKGLYKKEKITDEKKNLVNNSNLAKIYDNLNLDENEVSIESKNQIVSQENLIHKKATFLEAIIWVYYLENGLEKTLNLINKFIS
jgi:dsRNA-specific ribonuclease